MKKLKLRCYAATRRSVSISFSHPTIWFQLGMLWDANSFSIFAISTDIKQMKRLLMDLSVNGWGHSASLSLVESYVSWLERRHVAAVLRREHASPNLFTEIYCDRYDDHY